VPSSRALLPFLIALILVGCGAIPTGFDKGAPTGAPIPVGPQVVFPGVTVHIELARTPAEQEKGLGGHTPLGERDGMLFIFDRSQQYAFWMKGMTFALDMMWIEEGKVVHLERDVPPPGPGATDASLPVYTPRAAARYVLEVNAGFTAKYGIDVGTPAQFTGV